MSTYSLDELLRKWSQGDLTPDQAIGHMLQHLTRLNEELAHAHREQQTVSAAPASGTPGTARRTRRRNG